MRCGYGECADGIRWQLNVMRMTHAIAHVTHNDTVVDTGLDSGGACLVLVVVARLGFADACGQELRYG